VLVLRSLKTYLLTRRNSDLAVVVGVAVVLDPPHAATSTTRATSPLTARGRANEILVINVLSSPNSCCT